MIRIFNHFGRFISISSTSTCHNLRGTRTNPDVYPYTVPYGFLVPAIEFQILFTASVIQEMECRTPYGSPSHREAQCSSVELVGAAYLPNNEDKGTLPLYSFGACGVLTCTLVFQMLADDFGKPTEEDVDSRCTAWSNPFFGVFRRLSEASISNSKSASIHALRDFLDLLLLVVPVKRAHFTWTLGRRSSIMFTVPPSGVRCAMSCEAIIYLVDGTRVLPLCALLVRLNYLLL